MKGTFLSLIGGIIWYDMNNHRLLTQIPNYDFAFDTYYKMLNEDIISRLPDYARTIQAKYENLPVLTSQYAENYFHVTLECASALRLLDSRHDRVGVGARLRNAAYQHELIGHCLKHRIGVEMEDTAIHVDPILFFEYFSSESIDYVRNCVNKFANSGDDFIYIERKSSARKVTGTIAETPHFIDTLDRYKFKRISFGAGEVTLSDQISMMNGAKTIVAPHGAALTNLIYLNPPANVIEIVNRPLSSHPCYEEICQHLGLNYHRIIVEHEDENGDMLLDVQKLDDLLQALT